MLVPSEEVTKTWVKRKGILIKSRPEPSRFSFIVCLTIVFSIAFGFLGGFITAGFALKENFSSVYENLLTELENTRPCIEREKEKLLTLTQQKETNAPPSDINHANSPNHQTITFNNQIHDQAIFSVFGRALELLKKNDKTGGCKDLNNIIKIIAYDGEWKNKAEDLLSKNCH